MPLEWGTAKKSQAPSSLSWGKSKGAQSSSLSWDGKAKAGESQSLPVLEQEAAAAGAPVPAQDSPGLFRRVVDLISRPNYAAAGAAEELLTQRGGGAGAALKRVGSELFSGIGDIKGQKEGFAQVMEQSGVGEMGSLSDIAPWLYSESGKGLPLEKRGVLDFTGRGTIGFVGDVVFDPLTYVTAGAGKGIRLAGATLPGSVKALEVGGKVAKAAIKVTPGAEATLGALGKVFDRDWLIRNLPGGRLLAQGHLNRQQFEYDAFDTLIGTSKIAKVPRKLKESFFDAMDDGSWVEKYKNNPKMLEAAAEWKQINGNIAAVDVEHGLLKPEQIRENYAAHFYDNTPEEMRTLLSIHPRAKNINPETLGRHQEIRFFDTVKEAEDWSKAQHAIDPTVPILKPVRDPLDVLQRRGRASIDAIENIKFNGEIKHVFGRKVADYDPMKVYEIAKPIPVPPHEAIKIEQMVQSGGSKFDDFLKLSTDGRKEFVRNKLLQAETSESALEIISRYGPDHAPKQTSLAGRLAEDGSPYVSVLLGKERVEIPHSMYQYLSEMSESALKNKNTGDLVRWYDRSNNVFKSFVTVMFPAFHFRNAYSNLAQAFADVGLSILNPARHYDGVNALRGAEGGITNKIEGHIPYKQMQDEMARNGVTTTGRRLAEHTGEGTIDRLATVGGKIKAAPRAFGGMVENEARASLYSIYRRQGMDAVSAAERVNKVLFDYGNLSRIEQQYFRRIFPFYTWTRKNIERQGVNLLTKPGLTAAEIKPFRGREDENGMLTSWDAEALKFRLNRDGRTLRVLSGVDLPIKGLDFMWNGNLQGTIRQSIGMISPLLKAPLEVGFGVNAFTGKEMTRQTSNSVGQIIETLNPPKGVQQWLGYQKEFDKAGRPKYTFDGQRFYMLFQSWALSRLVSTSDRQFRTFTESPEWSRVMLDALTGLRDKEMNLDDEQAKGLVERKRQLEESLVRWGKRREYNRVYKPKGTQ